MIQQIHYSIIVAVLLLPGSLTMCGCQRPPIEEIHRVSQEDDLQAEEILRATLEQYSVARSYQDKAVLYLSYRLNGRAIEEPQHWSIAWDRNGLFSANWFNAQIRCDGQQLSCYVFDIDSGNVDNQQLLVPAVGEVPLDRVFRDPIAAHFIFGKSELPLHETGTAATAVGGSLMQPIIGPFDSSHAASWLHQPDRVQRLDDDDSIGRACYVIQCTDHQRNYRVWIDQEFGLIEQVEFPLDYLDSGILAAEEVTDLRFFVRFHDAKLNLQIPPQLTEVKLKLAAKPVSRFVTLPQSMASTRIGEIVELDEFVPSTGQPIDPGQPPATTTVLLWLSVDQAEQQVRQLAAARDRFADRAVRCLAVCGDEFRSETSGASFELSESMSRLLVKHDLTAIHDRQLAVSTAVGLKVVPAMMVVDDQRRIQFAKALDGEDWAEQLAVAITRTLGGEQLADEMKQQYQEFLDDYHRQLASAASQAPTNQNAVSSTMPMFEQQAELQWTNDSLQNPGNILILPGSDRLQVLDGWRSIVELDFSGNIVATHRLQLPDGVAINRVRSFVDAEGVAYFVVFSLLGKQAFVFDAKWQPIKSIPKNETTLSHRGITECQLVDVDQDGQPELLISFLDQNGLRQIDLVSEREKQLFGEPVKTFALISQGIVLISDGKLYLDSQPQAKRFTDGRIDRLFASPFDPGACYAIGRSKNDRWQVLNLDVTEGIKRTDEIGSQFFETEIDSISVSTSADSESMLAIGSAGESLLILNSNDLVPRMYQLDAKLTGIATKIKKNARYVALASKNQVSLWKVPERKPQVVPVSDRREMPAEGR